VQISRLMANQAQEEAADHAPCQRLRGGRAAHNLINKAICAQ